jgi:hypothetical protein
MIEPDTRKPSLWRDLRRGWSYAAGLSFVAFVIIGVASSTRAASAQPEDAEQLRAGLAMIIVGYFLGGTLAGVALWTLRPLRRWLLGWMLTGFVISALAYGAVGVTGIGGLHVGANLLDFESAAEGWRLLPRLMLFTGLPGSLAGLYYWSRERRRRQGAT